MNEPITQRDRDELLRAANIVSRFAVLRKSEALHAIADYLMLELTRLDDPGPAPVKP
jgi:hypothetical protein